MRSTSLAKCYRTRLTLGQRVLYATALLSVSICSASAATYYIDPTCSASGDGTTQTCGVHGPFKTWAEVSWAAGNSYAQKGGTTVYETIKVGTSGAPGSPIMITSYGNGKAFLNGAITIPSNSWTANDPVAGTYSHPSFGRLTLEDGVYIQQCSVFACGSGTSGNQYFESQNKNYYIPTSGAPSDHVLEYPRELGIDLTDRSYITITGLSFTKYRTAIGDSTSQVTNSDITIKNNDFSNSEFGVWLWANNAESKNIIIVGNTFDHIFSSVELGVYGVDDGGNGHFANSDISNNIITHCSEVDGTSAYRWDLTEMSGWDREGIGTQNLQDSTVKENKITGYCRGIVFYGGNGYDNSNLEVVGNYIDTNLSAILFQTTYSPTASGHSVHDNLLVGGGDDLWTSTVFLDRPSDDTSYSNFYNNTLLSDKIGIWLANDYWKVENNIVYGSAAGSRLITSIGSHVVIDYNLYYEPAGNAVWWTDQGGSKVWQGWQAAGYDTHGVYADPLFTNAAEGDYSLTSTSPAIDKGAEKGIRQDFLGSPVPVGAGPDIGAMEYREAIGRIPSPVGLKVWQMPVSQVPPDGE